MNKYKNILDELSNFAYAFRSILKILPPSSFEKKMINVLRNEINNLPNLELKQSSADNEWIMLRMKIRSLIIQEDPRFFLNWDIIRQTMFVENASYTANELEYLKQGKDWNSRYEKAIRENNIGSPKRYCEYKQSSGNLIHHAYSLNQFEEKTKVAINNLKLVLEFGGGYGSMYRLFHNMGFKGKYIIFDFDEFGALQKYFLRSSGYKVMDINEASNINSGILCISDLSQLQKIIKKENGSLLLATWSISETSVEFRRNFFDNIPELNYYFIAYYKQFGEVDNIGFFSYFAKRKKEHKWQNWEIPHLKGNYYLIGSK